MTWYSGTVSWSAVEAVGTWGAVIVAAWQIRLARRDGNKRQMIELMGGVQQKLDAAMNTTLNQAQGELLAYYSGGPEVPLSQGGQRYLELLSSLELLAFACAQQIADPATTYAYLRTLERTKVISLSFLKEFQRIVDSTAYEHLYTLLIEIQRREN